MNRVTWVGVWLLLVTLLAASTDEIKPASDRFAKSDAREVPDFRRHVIPLLSKVGCNGRACHGSFQGQGGFQLSLFGYDFDNDYRGIEERIEVDSPEDSYFLHKPTLVEEHEGGKRLETGSWEYNLLVRWIEGGANNVAKDAPEFVQLDVTPAEIVFDKPGATAQLKAVSVWSDGAREDVTSLCRFQSNDSQIALIDVAGTVTAGDTPGDTHVVVFYDNGVVPVPVIRPISEFADARYPEVPAPTTIDRLVTDKLRKMGIVPSDLCTDEEFLRRVSLDMTGTLPTAREVTQFLADTSGDKRARKIDELLERPSYAAWWTTRLCDITGNNDDVLNNVTPIRSRASQDWYDWIYQRVAKNEPYDELAAGIVLATSRESGESFAEYCEAMSALYREDPKESFADRESMPHYWARSNFRDAEDRAIGFSYAFMGIRIQCAQCHKHPFDQWTKEDFEQFTGFFESTTFSIAPESRDEYEAMLKNLDLAGKQNNDLLQAAATLLEEGKTVPFREVYSNRPRRAVQSKGGGQGRRRGSGAASAKLLGAESVDLTESDDPRQPLMDWLRRKDNPYFARSFVNRVWADYFNVGIVHPTDDLSLANPPSNKPLLDYLTDGFTRSGYNMKTLHRAIANSRTYQLSWKPNDTNRLDEHNFSRAVPRRLPAEVAYDAIVQATASDEKSAAMQTGVDGRAIAIPGASTRRGGNQGVSFALSVFGRSVRESNCDCDRSEEASLLQTVFRQNDQDVLVMIDRRDGWLAQVAGELGVRFQPAATSGGRQVSQPKRPDDYNETVAGFRTRIDKLQSAGKSQEAKQVQKQLAAYQRRYASAALLKAPEVEVAAIQPLINQAYLRTLSRNPDEQEMAAAQEFVAESDDAIAGLRGLLWALLNTKEFIVNH